MSDHHRPPNPGPSAARDITISSSAGAAGDDEALMKMQRDFPGHRIWREIIPGRTVYVARSHHPAARPHTVVTPDLRELHAVLTESSLAGGPR
jgi:hypothetical protein